MLHLQLQVQLKMNFNLDFLKNLALGHENLEDGLGIYVHFIKLKLLKFLSICIISSLKKLMPVTLVTQTLLKPSIAKLICLNS